MKFTSPHSGPYARLVADVVENGGCWCGTSRQLSGRTKKYQRADIRVPGLGGRVVHLLAHRLTWVAHQLQEEGLPIDNDSLWLAYWELHCSGYELDHTCNNPACRRPVHLDLATRVEQEQRKVARRNHGNHHRPHP